MNDLASTHRPEKLGNAPRNLLRGALITWASLWIVFVVRAVLVALDRASDARKIDGSTIVIVLGALLLLWGLVVLAWKRPALGALAFLAFAALALMSCSDAAAQSLIVLPALAFGAAFGLLAWNQPRSG